MVKTYGVIICRSDGRILLCHPTGHGLLKRSIPKGLSEVGESAIESAIREVKEETNLDLLPHKLIPLSCVRYKGRSKVLQPFYYNIREDELLDVEFGCNSYFSLYGKDYPECDGWDWVDYKDISKYDIHLTQVLAIGEWRLKVDNIK
jgi:8-oxo-dGTP pyrophosphatase MutT (NUDIX family)